MARRKSWTVIYGNGRRGVWLAENPRALVAECEAQGYTWKGVIPGDSSPTTTGRFRIDSDLLRQMARHIGLRDPVQLRFAHRKGSTLGSHRWARKALGKGRYHDIMLKSYLSARKANATLWHELAHALQAEATGSYPAWRRLIKREKSLPYSEQPTEREADAYAQEHEHIRLAKKS